MAREKGTGSLQREKSGRYTARVSVNGVRYSRSTRTTDKTAAEKFLNRMLAPFGLGDRILPLSDVWREYEKSPNRREQTEYTMNSKRVVWMKFAEWIEQNHLEITQLKQLSADAVAEYLRVFRIGHSASTYNNHICVLREICRCLSDKAGIVEDPWAHVRLLPDDSHTRREFSLPELQRIADAAARVGGEWPMLIKVGMYTGLRLGDCCQLAWSEINLEREVIQLIPRKTKKFGKMVTIPIHPVLKSALLAIEERSGYVMPQMAEWYRGDHWKIDNGLKAIFADAGIKTSVIIDGRRQATPDATFHSFRHTFVSFSANAGVPLPVVASIVGHTSTSMTRHYYHENEAELRRAVEAMPSLAPGGAVAATDCKRTTVATMETAAQPGGSQSPRRRAESIPARLKRLDALFGKGLITEDEFKAHRARILSEV